MAFESAPVVPPRASSKPSTDVNCRSGRSTLTRRSSSLTVWKYTCVPSVTSVAAASHQSGDQPTSKMLVSSMVLPANLRAANLPAVIGAGGMTPSTPPAHSTITRNPRPSRAW